MKNLLIISSKLNQEINDFKKNNSCETLILNKNLKDILKKKQKIKQAHSYNRKYITKKLRYL